MLGVIRLNLLQPHLNISIQSIRDLGRNTERFAMILWVVFVGRYSTHANRPGRRNPSQGTSSGSLHSTKPMTLQTCGIFAVHDLHMGNEPSLEKVGHCEGADGSTPKQLEPNPGMLD